MGSQYDSWEELLALKFPKTYLRSIKSDNEQHYYRVIEAIGEGVVFTTLEHSADSGFDGCFKTGGIQRNKSNGYF